MYHRYHKTKPRLRKKVSKNMTNPRKMGVKFKNVHSFRRALIWMNSKYSPYSKRTFSFVKPAAHLRFLVDYINENTP